MFRRNKKAKQFIEFLGSKDASSCNDEDLRSLLRVADDIKASAHLNSHVQPRFGFEEQLKQKVLAYRQHKPKHMKNPFSGVREWFASLFTMKTWVPVGITSLIVLILLSSMYFWPGVQNGSPKSLFSGFSKLVISPAFAEDNFELKAVKADSLGVETNSSYILTSKEALETSAIKDHLTVEPKVNYEIKQLSDKEWEIIPDSPIEPNTIVKVALVTSYVDDTGTQKERDYSWAFQVKDTFKVLNTIPRDKSSHVPVDSGIEITFSHDNFGIFSDFVSISPAIEGVFEKHGRTLVFVPKHSLPQKTIYTVTVKKGYPLNKSQDVLSFDYTFSFETDSPSNYENNYYFNVGDKFQEFSSTEKALVQVFSSGDEAQVIQARIYRFNSEQDFIKTMKEMDSFPYWSSSREDYRVNTKNLPEVMSFSTEVKVENYVRYVEFPEALSKGFYVADFSFGNQTAQAYMQVSDLITYINASRTDTIVWVNDLGSKNPVDDAHISFLGTGLSYQTNEKGIATFKTPNIFKPEDKEKGNIYLKINKGSDVLIINADKFISQDISAKMDSDYWQYIYTDRPMYQTSDDIKFWGMLKDRSGNAIKEKVTVTLFKEGYVDYYYRPVYIAEQELQLSDLGTFSGNFEFKNLKPDYYTLELRIGELSITRQYITIEPYVKPAYQISLERSSSVAYAGEVVSLKAKATFFEGTPVPQLNLTAHTPDGAIDLITNEAGEAEFTYVENYQDCKSSYGGCWPQHRNFSVQPAGSELSEIIAETQVRFFGPRVYLNSMVTYPEPGLAQVTLETKKIDLKSMVSDEWWNRSRGEEKAPGTRVVGEVRKITYAKIDTGTKYDFINKQRYTTYRYDRKEEVVDTFDVRTDFDGSYVYYVNVLPEISYDVTFYVYDEHGLYDIEKTYIYYYNGQRFFRNYYGNEDYDYYFLEREEEKLGYNVGEVAHIRFMHNDDISPDGKNRYLFLQMQNGLQEYSIENTALYAIPFEQRDIPNVNIVGVYFTGATYKSVQTGMFESGIVYDTTSKKLKINISTEKKVYKPGEEVVLDVLVTDKNDRVVESEVNLNLVDEAFYALRDDVASPLEKIYGNVDSGSLFTIKTHYSIVDVYGGAEMGGCFVGGTMIRLSDGSQKPIEDITKGDSISTFESSSRMRLSSGTVTEVFEHVVPFYLRINGTLGVTPVHLVYSNGQFVEAGKLKVGDWLLNAQGEKVIIESIEPVNGFVKVYNFRVDPQHTYFANDLYVHNEKGGGPREFFTDAALFRVVKTDSSGKARVTFTLPDNITSWRVTAQALTEDLHVGTNTAKIPVSLPVFAEIGVGKEYLKTDKPQVKLRAFGTALSSKDDVEFSVEAKTLGVENSGTFSSKAFSTSYYALPPLVLGTHNIVYNVKTSKGKDSLKLPLTVIDSRLEARVAKEEKLTTDTVITAENDKPVTVVLSDQGQNILYGPLLDLSWSWGDRIDQILVREQAKILLRDYYTETISKGEINASLYQLPSGGISLLPYSSEDLELSARIVALKTDIFDNEALRQYFFQTLEDKNSNREQVGLALFGLAELGEPVLPRIHVWLERTDLSVMEKLYMAQALFDIGDAETARDMYLAMLQEFGQQKDPYIILRINNKPDEVFKATMRVAVLASSLQRSEALGFWNYVIDNQILYGENQNSEELYTIEKLSFIGHMLPKLKPSPSEVTLTLFGEEQKIKLTGGSTYDIQLDASHVGELKFTSVIGEVGVSTIYIKSLALQNVSRDSSVGIGRKYFVNGRETLNFTESDTVEVRLYPQFGESAIVGMYQITDILPLGMVPIAKMYERNLGNKTYDLCTYYPYNVDGSVVKFMLDRYWNSYGECSFMRYYARVKTPGEYKAESTIIQSMVNPKYLNYSPELNVVITH